MSSDPLFLYFSVATDGENTLYEHTFRGRKDGYKIRFADGRIRDWQDYNATRPRPKKSPLGGNWRWMKD